MTSRVEHRIPALVVVFPVATADHFDLRRGIVNLKRPVKQQRAQTIAIIDSERQSMLSSCWIVA